MDAANDALKARMVHRRFQRMKAARYDPTASYTPIAPTDPASPTSPSANPPPNTPPPSAASTPNNTPSSPPVQPTSDSQPAQQPGQTSSTPQPAQPSDTNANSQPANTPSTPPNTPSSTPTPSAPGPTSAPPSASTPAPSAPAGPSAQQSAPSAAAPFPGYSSPSDASHQSVTKTVPGLPASGSPSPSPSGTPTSSGGVSAAVVIGIVVGVIVGIAGIVFAVTYFIRRQKKDDDDEDFNADAFKRQSTALMDSDPSPIPNRGITPRPPSMFEQRMGQGPVSYGQQPYGGNNGYYGYPDQASYNPGQVMAMPGQPLPPQAWSPAPMQPFYSPMGESPMGSPVSVAHYDSNYDAQGNLIREPSPGPADMLNRQPSMSATQQLGPQAGPGAYVTRQAEAPGMTLEAPNAHYVDLARSSVSPYQAEQYTEIAQQLSSPPPAPMPSPLAAAVADEIITKDVDPVMPEAPAPRPLNVVNQGSNKSPHSSVGSVTSPFDDSQYAHEMPKPPSPTFSQKTRVDSTPPTLPEMQRAFSPVSLEFPMNAKESTPRAAPSPLSASVQMPAAPAEAHVSAPAPAHEVMSPVTPRPRESAPPARPDTVYTMYDDDDAYGGI